MSIMEAKISEQFDDLSVDETLEIDGGAFPSITKLPLTIPIPTIAYGINIIRFIIPLISR